MKQLTFLFLFLLSVGSFAQEKQEIPVAEQLKDSCEVLVLGSGGIIINSQSFHSVFCLDYRLEVYSSCELDNFEFTVFNRWGEIVYSSNNQNAYWNGTYKDQGIVPDGVYIFVLTYTDQNGQPIKQHGNVTLVK